MRQIISLSDRGTIAVCNDGTLWFWTGERWDPLPRSPVPQPPSEGKAFNGLRYSGVPSAVLGPEHLTPPPAANAQETIVTPSGAPLKRGPGRPRKESQ